MPNVYIVNQSSHDYSKAELYGKLIPLSIGSMNRYQVNDMVRKFSEKLNDSNPDDYLVMSGLAMMNTIAATVFALKHHRLNLLLFKNGHYVERNVVFDVTKGKEIL